MLIGKFWDKLDGRFIGCEKLTKKYDQYEDLPVLIKIAIEWGIDDTIELMRELFANAEQNKDILSEFIIDGMMDTSKFKLVNGPIFKFLCTTKYNTFELLKSACNSDKMEMIYSVILNI